MDCYIVIRAENQNSELVRKFDKLIRENKNVHSINYAADDSEGMMNEIFNIPTSFLKRAIFKHYIYHIFFLNVKL